MTGSYPVFVVDDDAIRDLLASYLEKNGFTVITAADGTHFPFVVMIKAQAALSNFA